MSGFLCLDRNRRSLSFIHYLKIKKEKPVVASKEAKEAGVSK